MLIVGAQPSNNCGNNPTVIVSSLRTGATRRRTQRSALGSVTGSLRNWSAAASRLLACSTTATTCSISHNVPGKRAVR